MVAKFRYRFWRLPIRRLSGPGLLYIAGILAVCLVTLLLQTGQNGEHTEPATGQYQEKLVERAREDATCVKPENAEGYVVCKRLPYTEIKCGNLAKAEKISDEFGRSFLVPDTVHFIWFGPVFNISQHYQYLTLRSVASIQRPKKILFHYNSDTVVQSELRCAFASILGCGEPQYANFVEGDIWKRIRREIPCIEMVRREAPDELFDITITEDLFKADIARLQILKELGGIYLDLDVLTLKSLDPLRIHAAAVGRSVINKISNGIILSERDSGFINIWLDRYKTYDPRQARTLAYWGLNVPYSIWAQARGSGLVHLEETSFNRPNPYLDGLDSTLSAHIDITDNYFLHIHPKAAKNTKFDINLEQYDDDKLRTLDSVYGQAARIALFGSEELVFFPGEQTQEPWPKRRVFPFPEEGADPL